MGPISNFSPQPLVSPLVPSSDSQSLPLRVCFYFITCFDVAGVGQTPPATGAAATAAYISAMTVESVLSNIFVFRVLDFAEQVACVKALSQFIKVASQAPHIPIMITSLTRLLILLRISQEHPQVRVIILDSVAFHFRAEFEDMAQRQRLLQTVRACVCL